MSEKKVPPRERILSSFKQLATASTDLNAASQALSQTISSVDASLKSVEPFVSTWHEIASGRDDGGGYWHRDIGYSKVEKTWGIALRTVQGHEGAEHDDVEVWLFKDAPRWMQIESVGKIPDLLDQLVKRTLDTTKKLRAKTIEAEEMARALADALAERQAEKKEAGSDAW